MRRSDQLFKTMTAARHCIGECQKHASPLDYLDKYVGQLRANPLWLEPEINEVETTARRALEAARGRDRTLETHTWSLADHPYQSAARA
jgi:hypothetical protein